MTIDTLLSKPSLKFDRWGRYVIPHPDTGAEHSWTRASTVAKTLDDEFALTNYKLRMTGKGIALRRDLLALASATGVDDKAAWRGIVDQAQAAAASGAKANIGTALHAFTERLDNGETLEAIDAPEPWAADLVAYQKAMLEARINVLMIEAVVTLPHLSIAGQLDRILGLNRGLPVIGDLKTGGYLNFQAFAMQFAIYANAATIYEPTTGTHRSMPLVDRERALIVHLPAGEARCDLYWLDIAAGWEAVQLAMAVRKWRSRKDLHQAFYVAPKNATGKTAGEAESLGGQPAATGTPEPTACGPSPSLAESAPAEGSQPPAADSAPPKNDGKAEPDLVTGPEPSTGGQGLISDGTHSVDSGSVAPPGPPALADPADIEAVRRRVHALIAAGHGEQLAGLWPMDHPTLKQGGLTQSQLVTIAGIVRDVEREHDRPFHESSADTPEFVAGDDPAVVDAVRRLRALPRDLGGLLATFALGQGMPKLSSGRATPDHLAEVRARLLPAEQVAHARAQQIRIMLAPYDMSTESGREVCEALLDAAAPRPSHGTTIDELTAAEVDNLRALIAAIDLCIVGLTYEGERPVLMTTDQADKYIADRHETRKAAVSAAGTVAERLGRKRKPRSMPEVLKDPLLAATVATLPFDES